MSNHWICKVGTCRFVTSMSSVVYAAFILTCASHLCLLVCANRRCDSPPSQTKQEIKSQHTRSSETFSRFPLILWLRICESMITTASVGMEAVSDHNITDPRFGLMMPVSSHPQSPHGQTIKWNAFSGIPKSGIVILIDWSRFRGRRAKRRGWGYKWTYWFRVVNSLKAIRADAMVCDIKSNGWRTFINNLR